MVLVQALVALFPEQLGLIGAPHIEQLTAGGDERLASDGAVARAILEDDSRMILARGAGILTTDASRLTVDFVCGLQWHRLGSFQKTPKLFSEHAVSSLHPLSNLHLGTSN